MIVQYPELPGFQQPFVTAKNADSFPALLCSGFRDGSNHGVEARAIPSASYDSYFLFHGPNPQETALYGTMPSLRIAETTFATNGSISATRSIVSVTVVSVSPD